MFVAEGDGDGAMGCKGMSYGLGLVTDCWRQFSAVLLDDEPAVTDLEDDTAVATKSEELLEHQGALLQKNHMA